MKTQLSRRSVCAVSGVAALLGMACSGRSAERPADWSEATHGSTTAPNYELLFDSSVVQRIDVRIAAADFAAMQTNIEELVGARGGPMGGPGGGGFDPGAMGFDGGAFPGPNGFGPPAGFVPPGGDGGPPGGGNGALSLLSEDPMYVPVEIRHDGHVWTHVGMRYKGNSSLASSNGNGKNPFRLNFDKYEGDVPSVRDQRFYGFDELTFSSNWNDDSQLRELFATELLRDRGVPAARAAFCRVFVDVGDGAEYWGLYTLIEDPSDGAMLAAQFGDGSGNLYKPEGDGADWTHFSADGFAKKTNEDAADYSDVESAVSALHADRADAGGWRAELEQHLDVDGFLRWLAVNTVMVNWDSYGGLAHNYYLYGEPSRLGQLRWIPWDHNLSMQSGGMGPARASAASSASDEIFHTSVGSEWPLISVLLSDANYGDAYRAHVGEALGGLFEVRAASARLRELHDLVAPYVVGTDGERAGYTTISSEAAFADSVDGATGLIAHVTARQARVAEALAAP